MEEEFEITYLVKELPKGALESPSKEITDVYIPTDSEHSILRLRKSGDRYEITKKEPIVGTDSSHQYERTIPLTQEEFDGLNQIPGRRLTKTRYYYKEDGATYEIDVFGGDLEGLVMVDVEFKDAEEKDAFEVPDWFLADVTQEKFVAGGVLYNKTYEDITEKLESFGYQKL